MWSDVLNTLSLRTEGCGAPSEDASPRLLESRGIKDEGREKVANFRSFSRSETCWSASLRAAAERASFTLGKCPTVLDPVQYVPLASGWLVTARLLVRSPVPPSGVSRWARRPHPNCSWQAGCRPAWSALWIEALYKWPFYQLNCSYMVWCSTLSIYETWTMET